LREIKLTREDWLSGRDTEFWAASILRDERVIEPMLAAQLIERIFRAHLI
jgi:hypothetical protein